jgi:AraC-like DNA-binding protein
MKTKPTFEKINTDFENSIFVRQHTESCPYNLAFWHFHPEIELVYVNNGSGKTHIGNHISYFNNSQLILIGSNLPHTGFSDRLTYNGKETLVQFLPNIFEDMFLKMPEFKRVISLLERAKKGLLFGSDSKAQVGEKIESLASLSGISRIITLLDIFNDLASSKDYTILNADGYALETNLQDSNKIDKIYKYVNGNFQNHISLRDIADEVSMTVPAFCRYFKKVTGKTFTQLVNEYRIVHATKLLSESQSSQSSITDICYECGFNNFSHFNKQFKEFTGKSASNYRKELKLIIQS